jgi:hypothetical protein
MPRGERVTDQDLAKVKDLRKSGMTVKDIAKKLGLNYWATYSRLRKVGGVKTRRGRRARGTTVRRAARANGGRMPRTNELTQRFAQALVSAGVDPVALAGELLRMGQR